MAVPRGWRKLHTILLIKADLAEDTQELESNIALEEGEPKTPIVKLSDADLRWSRPEWC
jgi:hypothetical protein